jgi:hypothetical protein
MIMMDRQKKTGNCGNPDGSGRRIAMSARLVLLAALMAWIPVQDTLAQSGGFSGAYTRMGFGARGMAMGNAMGTVTQEGVFSHYNPALAAFATGNQIDLGTALMSFDRSLHSLNVTFPLPPSAGLNIGLLNANVYDIDGRTSSGYHTEMLSTHEFQLFAAFGISLSPRVHLGISAKLHYASFLDDIDNATGAGFDIGLITEPVQNWRIGLAVQDLISSYTWNTNPVYGTLGGRNRSDPIPVRFRFSTSYRLPDFGLIVSSEYEIQRQESEIVERTQAGGVVPPRNTSRLNDITTNSQLFRIGAAWHAHERFTVRGGWEIMDLDYVAETHKLSAGFSVHLPYDAMSPSVDYAFVREPMGIAGMHVLTLRLSL